MTVTARQYVAPRCREDEIDELAECMCSCYLPSQREANIWDQWELRYLAATGHTTVPSRAYEAAVAGLYA